MEEEVYEEFLKNLSKKIDLKKNGSFSKLIEERDRFLVVGLLEKGKKYPCPTERTTVLNLRMIKTGKPVPSLLLVPR